MMSRWNPGETDWKKWVKCGLCGGRFVVNNYDDRKIRISQHKIGGVIVCGWCKTRYGVFVVQLLKIAQQAADGAMLHCIAPAATCKCTGHVALRVLEKAGKLQTGRKK